MSVLTARWHTPRTFSTTNKIKNHPGICYTHFFQEVAELFIDLPPVLWLAPKLHIPIRHHIWFQMSVSLQSERRIIQQFTVGLELCREGKSEKSAVSVWGKAHNWIKLSRNTRFYIHYTSIFSWIKIFNWHFFSEIVGSSLLCAKSVWGPVLAARITYLRRIISPSNSVRKCLIDILETLIIRGTFSIKAATGTIPGVVKSAQTLRF